MFRRRGQTTPAREATLPVAYGEHSGQYAARVCAIIASLDKDRPTSALAVSKAPDGKDGRPKAG